MRRAIRVWRGHRHRCSRRYPFASGRDASRCPALIVHNNRDNRRLNNTIIAQITTTMRHVNDPTSVVLSIYIISYPSFGKGQ